jgi:serine/threonine protein kinase
VLLQALAYNPGERFQHTQVFADAYLHALMGLPIHSSKHSGTQGIVPSLSISITDNSNSTKKVNQSTGEEGKINYASTRRDTNQDNVGTPLITPLSPITTVDKDVDVNNKMGNSESSTLNCATCGTANRINAKHCSTCGKILQPVAPASSTFTGTGTPIPSNWFIQHYHILGLLGRGGHGSVYKAQDT